MKISEMIKKKEYQNPYELANEMKIDPLVYESAFVYFQSRKNLVTFQDIVWLKDIYDQDIMRIYQKYKALSNHIDTELKSYFLKLNVERIEEERRNEKERKEKEKLDRKIESLKPLKDFSDSDLAFELRQRGYTGELKFRKDLNI